MKRILTIVWLLLPAWLGAQNSLQGRLVDAQTGAPEIGAVTQLLEGESVRAYALTDSLGVFTLESRLLKADTPYLLVVENLGRKPVRREVALAAGRTEIGDIPLEDDLQALESSKVVSARKLIKMDVDKVTYDVAEDVESKASTVLDMLRKVPMVTVDGQDNITVNGSSSFKVYVDGKPNEMFSSNPSKIFKVMPASSVKNIEVITNPGAKYDAEGTGGVLNLITQRNADGTSAIPDGANGTLSAGANSQGSVSGGLYLNVRKKKFTLGLNAYTAWQPNRGVTSLTEQTMGETVIRTEAGPSTQKTPFTSVELNANYEADSLNLVSASFGFDYWSYRSQSPGETVALFQDAPLYSYHSQSESFGAWSGYNAGLDYQHTFRSSKLRTLTLSYRLGIDPQKGRSLSLYSDRVGTEIPSRRVLTDDGIDSHTLQGDFTTPLGSEKHLLSSGLKFTYRHNRADDFYHQLGEDGETVLDESESKYHHYNYIAAVYSEYSGTVGKWGLKAGLRYEHTFQTAVQEHRYKVNYPNFVPNASIQWNFAPTQNIGLAYNMRIRRPGINYLSPFINRSSPTSISYGNPDLVPAQDHSFKLEYHFFSPKVVLNAALSYRFGNGSISQYAFYGPDPEDPAVEILQNTYGNIVDNHGYMLNYFISWNPWKDTRIYSSGNGGYQTFRSRALGESNQGWNGFLNAGIQQTIPWDIRLSANFFGMTRRYSLQGWNGGFCGLSAGISKSFLEDRLNISLRGFTNFNKGKARFRGASSGNGYSLSTETRVPVRQIGLEISWTFGKKNIQVKKVGKTISDDDVMSGERGGAASTATQAAGM